MVRKYAEKYSNYSELQLNEIVDNPKDFQQESVEAANLLLSRKKTCHNKI